MDVTAFKRACAAYEAKDYETALPGFVACSRELDGMGDEDKAKLFQLLGNCQIRTGAAERAAESYVRALPLAPDERKPVLYVALGTALLSSKDYDEALSAFKKALDYPAYRTPHKAYSGIAAAQFNLGKLEDAGAAWREAALDPNNPKPAKSLVNLGVCFMELARPKDAIISYETALELGLDDKACSKAQAQLGQAYMADGHVKRAIAAFEKATADGSYELSEIAAHDYEVARSLEKRLEAKAPGILDTSTLPVSQIAADAQEDADPDPFEPQTGTIDPVEGKGESGYMPFEPADVARKKEASGLSGSFDPLAPSAAPVHGSSASAAGAEAGADAAHPDETGEIPSPEQSDFFDATDDEIEQEAIRRRRKKRRARGTGLKAAIVVVVVLIVLVAAAIGAYVMGYGYPTAESVAQGFFAAAQDKQSTDAYWDDSVEASSRSSQLAALSGISGYSVEGVERSMAQTSVYVKSTLQEGGDIYYELVLSRDGLGWKVQYVELYFPSRQ